ncbi:MAG: hypothetical protein ACK5NG_05610 [Chthoniobacterales bacterium]
MKGFFFGTVFVFFALTCLRCEAGKDRIWAAVVVATQKESANPSKHLQPYLPTIQKAFGYAHAHIRDEENKKLEPGKTYWLKPGDGFAFKVICEQRESADYLAKVEAYEGQRLIFNADTKLARGEPIFIRGPKWGQERILLLLAVE